jgi:hypothetical protein
MIAVSSGRTAGGIVVITPLISTVAERSGLRAPRTRRSERPVRFCAVRATGGLANVGRRPRGVVL